MPTTIILNGIIRSALKLTSLARVKAPILGMHPRSQSLLLTAPERVEWVEQDLPVLGSHDLLVETRAGAISIGTELPQYRGVARGGRTSYPRMTGYESVGTVVARGDAVRRVRVHDRVVGVYGHRTSAVIPEGRAIVVPPEIGDELAVLLILSGDVATGVRKLEAALRGSVLVTGTGAIGLLAVFVLKALGTPAVDVVEPLAERRDQALELGARTAVPPEAAIQLAGEYAGGIECSARDSAFALLQEYVQPHGRICILSDGNIEPLTLAPAFHERQLAVVGSSDCPDYHAHAQWYFEVVWRAQPPLGRLFDRHVSATELPDIFARLADGSVRATKVLVRYSSS